MDKPPFAQTFVGAVLVAVLAGLIVWFLTGRQPLRVEVSSASAVPALELRPREASKDVATSNGPASRAGAGTEAQRSTPQDRTDDTCVEAVINDPDRYTNIRSGPGTKYKIVARVVDGDVFCVTTRNGHWWTIRTADGGAGYIYYDRVRFIKRL